MENESLPLPMNRQQIEVYELLSGLASERESFHKWYQGAVEVIGSALPDKVAQAAHSVRQLCDRLPARCNANPAFRRSRLPLFA